MGVAVLGVVGVAATVVAVAVAAVVAVRVAVGVVAAVVAVAVAVVVPAVAVLLLVVLVVVTEGPAVPPVGVVVGVPPGLATSKSGLTSGLALSGPDGELVLTKVSTGAWIVTGAEADNCVVAPPDVEANVSVLTLVTVCEPEPALGTVLSLTAATFTG